MPTTHAAVNGKTLHVNGRHAIFGTVSGPKLDVNPFGRTYGRPGAARHALLQLAAAAADSSLAEHASQHEHDDGTHTLSIVLYGRDVFVLPVLKTDPNQTTACLQMTWPRFQQKHPQIAATLGRAIRRHHEQHPGENIPDHVARLYPEAAPL